MILLMFIIKKIIHLIIITPIKTVNIKYKEIFNEDKDTNKPVTVVSK